MRRMIEKIEEFKREDGSAEFVTVEGNVNAKLRKTYCKIALNHNLATIVFEFIVPQNTILEAFDGIAVIEVPKLLAEHLELSVDKWIEIKDIIGHSKDSLVSAKVRLEGVDSTRLALKFQDKFTADRDYTFRTSFAFILQEATL